MSLMRRRQVLSELGVSEYQIRKWCETGLLVAIYDWPGARAWYDADRVLELKRRMRAALKGA